MSDSEHQLNVIKDILLPLDKSTRYDLYFTDKRIAIVCMGRSNRVEPGDLGSPSVLFGIAPASLPYENDKRVNRQTIENKIDDLPLDEKLKLSKKSCFYTHEEIEEVKLISGKKPKLVILSKDCVSKFSPNAGQFKQLFDLLPTIKMLESKVSIFGNLELKIPQPESSTFLCNNCGLENDTDAIFCESCGTQIAETDNSEGSTCRSCGAKNRVQATFCKKCGSPLQTKNNPY
jgi:ribosomal protein L40E